MISVKNDLREILESVEAASNLLDEIEHALENLEECADVDVLEKVKEAISWLNLEEAE